MSGGETQALLLFVKHAVPGSVKSRLSRSLDARTAADIYHHFILDILQTVKRTGIPVHICVHPPDAIPDMTAWLGRARTYLPQEGTDLGQRMERAFRAIFAQGTRRAVLIGSDLPDLPVENLHQAMEALDRHDAVIGPARDGGYYLIGFRKDRFDPGIFRGMAWSQPDVFERTMHAFRQKGTSVHLLPSWQDVDTIDDLHDLMQRNERTAFAGSRTMQYLETIRDRLSVTEGHHGKI